MFNISNENLQSFWKIFEDIISRSNAVLTSRMAYDLEIPSMVTKSGKVQDYVRYRSLELVAREIVQNNIKGNMAEAGVCKGAFACLINHLFPDRTLYLFDTFEGFSKEQIMNEHKQGLISDWFIQEGVFADTSVELVLANMPHKSVIKPMKGLFEDTCKLVDDTFAFVSLDMDLYEPMLVALEYFYPKMSKGGYIFMHDYNHSAIKGVKVAVNEYEKKHKIKLKKMPLPDEGGTLVLIK